MATPAKPRLYGPWYDLPPAKYAEAMRWYADRRDEAAAYHRQYPDNYNSRHALELCTRAARRLRAIAVLFERSTAATAGQVDQMGLERPGLPREQEDAVIAQIEALA